ncbi:hypothetical protein CSUB01_03416 [Colletotrichum sublineola]|uniref:Uncharacterized protein n=1 Tax=Colletotrichum sublineola TaxID=1173701 RepID=A0A066XH50_COLSU|nr:hypothetical protein CSUB01_03416 [Colletotrichum sublineola]
MILIDANQRISENEREPPPFDVCMVHRTPPSSPRTRDRSTASSQTPSSEEAASRMSNGADRPATARFAPIECRLHASAAPHRRSSPSETPHWRSMSTGPGRGETDQISWAGHR